QRLYDLKALQLEPASALELKESVPKQVVGAAAEFLGTERKTFAGEVLAAVSKQRMDLWVAHIHQKINWELFDRGVEAFTWAALEEIGKGAKKLKLLDGAPRGAEYARFLKDVALAGKAEGPERLNSLEPGLAPFIALRRELEKP